MFFSKALRHLPKTLSSLLPAALIASNTVLGGTPATCSNPQLSCQNTTAVADTCCFNAPGGQLLLTQFWDTDPPTGPKHSWTVHGLWWVILRQALLLSTMLISIGQIAVMVLTNNTVILVGNTPMSPQLSPLPARRNSWTT